MELRNRVRIEQMAQWLEQVTRNEEKEPTNPSQHIWNVYALAGIFMEGFDPSDEEEGPIYRLAFWMREALANALLVPREDREP